jgi:hypothetical protein
MKYRISVLLIVTIACTGCASHKLTSESQMSSPYYQDRNALQVSLFPGDTAVLSNEAIEVILTSKVELPNPLRRAIKVELAQP